jgi:predicted RND superfamily exporter protein
VALALALTVVLGLGLARLELRTDGASIYPDHNPVVEHTRADQKTFDDPQQVIVLVTAATTRLDSPAGLRFLAEAHRSLVALPGVSPSQTLSVASLLDVHEESGALSIGSLLDVAPGDSAGLVATVRRLRERPLTNGLLLSADGRAAAIYASMTPGGRRAAFVERLERWAEGRRTSEFDLRLTGPVIAEVQLGAMVLRDLAAFVPLMTALMAFLLLASLRSIAGAVLPMAEALVVLVWTFGAMGYAGMPVTLVTTILPVILMSTAITDEIHVLERVQDELAARSASAASPAVSRETLRQALLAGLRDVRWPIVGAAVTTAIGFLSFLSASIQPLRAFAVAAGGGILLAMLLSFTFMPALAMLLPLSWFRPITLGGTGVSHRLTWLERSVARAPGVAFALGIAALALCVPGPFRLRVQDAWMDNFDPRTPLVAADREFNSRFWGSYRCDVVLAGAPGLFRTPRGLALIAEVERAAAGGPHVGGALSCLDPLDAIAHTLGHGRPLSSSDPQLIAGLMTIAESSPEGGGLRQLVANEAATARVRLFATSPNYQRADSLRRHLERVIPALAAAAGVQWHASGDLPVGLEVVRAIVGNQLRSVAWGLVGILLLLWLVYPRGRAAWVAMAPVSAVALALFGAMGYLGLPLGIATSMFAGLAVGVGVDFALHFIYQFRIQKTRGEALREALESTLARTGRAIRWNALVVTLGFLVLTLSRIPPNRNLGLLLAAAVLTCYLATLALMPYLVRGLKAAPLALALLLLPARGGAAGAPVPASASPATPAAPAGAHDAAPASDPVATAVMERLERSFLGKPRALRFEASTTTSAGQVIERGSWGMLSGGSQGWNMIYVFTAPQVLEGATLLMRFRTPHEQDSTWLYLPGFQRVLRVGSAVQKVLVPGTTLSYEDSRGFIPTDHYRFSVYDTAANTSRGDTLWIAAWPAADSIRRNLGYGRLLIAVDRRRGLVARVEFAGDDLRPIKSYRLLEAVRVGGAWLPARTRLDHLQNGMSSEITYRYWPLRAQPAALLFDPADEHGPFLPRMLDALKREKIPLDAK